MAWIRRVRTSSGATAVQVAEYVDGRRKIVAHVGSARDEVTLGVLVERAQAVIDASGQGFLDLDVAPAVRKASLLAPAGEPTLLDQLGPGGRAGDTVFVGAPEVVESSSRLLYDVLTRVYSILGFDAFDDLVFRDVVVARVVEPTSILDTPRVLGELGREPVSDKTLRRAFKRAFDEDYRSKLAELCLAHAQAFGDISLVLYDVTTLYFEADKEDDLRKVGFSKERRVDPQVVVGLLVDRFGFPLEVGCFEGKEAETKTILPIIRQFKERHQIEHMVVVADAGMMSGTNLKALDEAGFTFIVGARTNKAPIDLESHFRWHGDAFEDGQVIDTITPKTGKNTENDKLVKAEPQWDSGEHPGSWRAVWAYSAKRWVRDTDTLKKQEERAREIISGDKSAKATRFVKLKGTTRCLDDAALARAKRLAGLKGYVTNIPATVMTASEIINSYHDLWHVEQSFRMSKSDLRARPMFVHKQHSIEAHLTVTTTALAIARHIQRRSGHSIRHVIRRLRPLRSATISVNGKTALLPPKMTENDRDLVRLLITPETQALAI